MKKAEAEARAAAEMKKAEAEARAAAEKKMAQAREAAETKKSHDQARDPDLESLSNWLSNVRPGMERFAEPIFKQDISTPDELSYLKEDNLRTAFGMGLGESKIFMHRAEQLRNVNRWNEVKTSDKHDQPNAGRIVQGGGLQNVDGVASDVKKKSSILSQSSVVSQMPVGASSSSSVSSWPPVAKPQSVPSSHYQPMAPFSSLTRPAADQPGASPPLPIFAPPPAASFGPSARGGKVSMVSMSDKDESSLSPAADSLDKNKSVSVNDLLFQQGGECLSETENIVDSDVRKPTAELPVVSTGSRVAAFFSSISNTISQVVAPAFAKPQLLAKESKQDTNNVNQLQSTEYQTAASSRQEPLMSCIAPTIVRTYDTIQEEHFIISGDIPVSLDNTMLSDETPPMQQQEPVDTSFPVPLPIQVALESVISYTTPVTYSKMLGPNVSPSPDIATPPLVDVVNFSAYAPPRIEPMQEFAVNIYAYIEQQREKMHAAATASGDESKATKAGLLVQRNSELTFALLPHEHFLCEDSRQTMQWAGNYTNVEFFLTALASLSNVTTPSVFLRAQIFIQERKLCELRIRIDLKSGAAVATTIIEPAKPLVLPVVTHSLTGAGAGTTQSQTYDVFPASSFVAPSKVPQHEDVSESHYDLLKSSDFADSNASSPTVKGEPCLLKMLPRVQVACALEDWVQAWQWRVENPVAVPEPMEVQFDRYFRGASAATETSLEAKRLIIETPAEEVIMAAQQRLASGAAWVNCDSLALFWSYEASQDQYLTTVWNSALKFRGPEFIQIITTLGTSPITTLPTALSAARLITCHSNLNFTAIRSEQRQQKLEHSLGLGQVLRQDDLIVDVTALCGIGNSSSVWHATFRGGQCVVKKMSLNSCYALTRSKSVDIPLSHVPLTQLAQRNSLPAVSPATDPFDIFLLEAVLASRLSNHAHVVQFFGCCCVKDEIWLVSEFVSGSSLRERLDNPSDDNLSSMSLCKYASQTAAGLWHLHASNIVHRDLSARNLLWDKGSDSIKVTDFGLSKYVYLSPDTPKTEESSLKVILTPSEDDKYGPIAWMSPEAINGNWSTRSDMYSYGVVLFEMLSRRIPFAEIHGPLLDTAKSILKGDRPNLTTTEENATAGSQRALLVELMKCCFETHPEFRPTAADVYRRLIAAM